MDGIYWNIILIVSLAFNAFVVIFVALAIWLFWDDGRDPLETTHPMTHPNDWQG